MVVLFVLGVLSLQIRIELNPENDIKFLCITVSNTKSLLLSSVDFILLREWCMFAAIIIIVLNADSV